MQAPKSQGAIKRQSVGVNTREMFTNQAFRLTPHENQNHWHLWASQWPTRKTQPQLTQPQMSLPSQATPMQQSTGRWAILRTT